MDLGSLDRSMSTGQPPPLKKMHAAGDVQHLDEGVVGEILQRLPAASLLRCRAVCAAWRRLADSPGFLAAHARRRPREILQCTRTEVCPDGVRRRPLIGSGDDFDLDAVSVFSGAGARCRKLARYPVADEDPYCSTLATCDGLLLLGQGRGYQMQPYLVCNPATRQWTQLPRVAAAAVPAAGRSLRIRESGFYRHAPSGEYRLLCHVTLHDEQDLAVQPPYYCVLPAGAGEPRRLATPASATWNHSGDFFEDLMAPAALGGRLHWLRHMEAGGTGSMVAFDTAAETFSGMPSPPVACKKNSRLLVADGATPTLMAAELGDTAFDLWALEGYAVAGGGAAEGGTMRWGRRHRVEVPWCAERPAVEVPWCAERLTAVAGAEDGSGDIVLGTDYGVVVYNVRSGVARRVAIDVVSERPTERLFLTRIGVLRESLVRHAFFDARPHPGLPLFRFF